MKPLLQALAAGAILAGVGCSLFIPKETLYLLSAKDRADQQQVRQQLGPPFLMTPTNAGEAVWVYQIREIERGSNNSWTAAGSWCDEYVLTFDAQGILRHWTHKSEKHRYEAWPSYCVTDGFSSAP